MQSIQDIPLLSREEVTDLAHEMRRHQQQFQRSLFTIPGTAVLVLERWDDRRSNGLVTAALSTHYRDGTGKNWNAHIDEHLGRVSELMGHEKPSRADVAEALAAAELSFELLQEIHAALRLQLEPSHD